MKDRLTRHGNRVMVTTQAKARPDMGEGIVQARTSVFGIEFTEGGGFKSRQVTIDEGAFDRVLQERPTAPIMWEHDWDGGPIGRTHREWIEDGALNVDGRLFLDEELPRRVWRNMTPGDDGERPPIDAWSIGFWVHEDGIRVEERGTDEDPKEDLYHYTSIDRAEHSVVLRGANPEAATVRVNAAGVAVDAFHEAIVPCTMPSEFTVAGRRYVIEQTIAVPVPDYFPDVIRLGGATFRVASAANDPALQEDRDGLPPARDTGPADERTARVQDLLTRFPHH